MCMMGGVQWQDLKGRKQSVFSLTIPPSTRHLSYNMCYRQVQCAGHGCGHPEPIGDAKVDCQSSQCRYSAAHPRGCPICPSTCVQWMGAAQTIVVRNGNPMCSHCARQNA